MKSLFKPPSSMGALIFVAMRNGRKQRLPKKKENPKGDDEAKTRGGNECLLPSLHFLPGRHVSVLLLFLGHGLRELFHGLVLRPWLLKNLTLLLDHGSSVVGAYTHRQALTP